MNKQRIANLLQRAPWTGYVAQAIYRLWQPWVTIGVVGVVYNANRQILLVEHVFHPKFPWGLPGGWMGRGEEPEMTVQREVLEETGLAIATIRPLAIARTKFLPQHLDVAYLCKLAPDAENSPLQLSSELLSYRWIDPTAADQIPPMALFHRRVVRAAVADQIDLATL